MTRHLHFRATLAGSCAAEAKQTASQKIQALNGWGWSGSFAVLSRVMPLTELHTPHYWMEISGETERLSYFLHSIAFALCFFSFCLSPYFVFKKIRQHLCCQMHEEGNSDKTCLLFNGHKDGPLLSNDTKLRKMSYTGVWLGTQDQRINQVGRNLRRSLGTWRTANQ